ncbi:MAG TPA: PfkB family carbohydrate kinase [Gammaproteobacteria bacterium]|nr:PfkB family carbohydrate kinase [Gammaproteobacteria bacterium]
MDQPITFQGNSRPAIFGEVLFDVFPDGSERLGGAPFNVAWHLQALGLNPLLISRVGNDAEGRQVLDAMHVWGMDTSGVQTDTAHPTGTVKVDIYRGEPSYTILPSQAYDFIDYAQAQRAVEHIPIALLYHGTLIARSSSSYQVLQALRTHLKCPVFVDINLRSPWWSGGIVESTLRGAQWVKMNGQELAEIVNSPVLETAQVGNVARELGERYQLQLLVVTLGAEGAYFVTQDKADYALANKVEVVDSVGAGDAFSAVTLLGLMRTWPLLLTQQRALEFAAAICRIPGALSHDPVFYREYRTRWEME